MTGFGRFDLGVRKTGREGVAVMTFRVNNGGGVATGCFEIKIRTNTSKLTNVRITKFRQCRDLVRKSEMFRPRLRAQWMVLREVLRILLSCLLPMRRNFVLGELTVSRSAVDPRRRGMFNCIFYATDARIKIIGQKGELSVISIKMMIQVERRNDGTHGQNIEDERYRTENHALGNSCTHDKCTRFRSAILVVNRSYG